MVEKGEEEERGEGGGERGERGSTWKKENEVEGRRKRSEWDAEIST